MPPPPPFWMTENEFRLHFSPLQSNTQIWLFFSPKWLTAAILDDQSQFSPFQINTQFFILFTKWLPATILDDRKSLSIAFLVISDQYTTFIFFHKWLPAAILDDWKSLSIAFLAISDQYATLFFFRPFWMTENNFWSYFSPFLINTQLWFLFTKWLPAAILDDRKSLSITFLAISDQYATLIFFHKMAAGGHFGWPKITFECISGHFRSIRNFFFLNLFFILEVPFGPFWMTKNHFRSHFSPFQINTQLFFFEFAPKTIGFFHYVLSMAMPNMKLIGEFVTQLEMPQAFWAFLYKMATRGHFVFPIDGKNHRGSCNLGPQWQWRIWIW